MKDMFHNYDYHINEKLSSHRKEPAHFSPDVLLTSDPNIAIIQDVKGREIGVKVKHGMPFTLYFYLDDYSTSECASNIEEYVNLLLNSSTIVEILSNEHNIVDSLEFNTADIFNIEASELVVSIPQETAKLLDKDSYRIRVALCYPGGCYELYSENDGLLIVR